MMTSQADDKLHSQAQRLRALWKSGRDKYASFFVVLDEVRHEIGNDALPKWCFDNLRISISVIVKTRKVLRETDAEIVKRNLAEAAAADKAPPRRERDTDEIAALRDEIKRLKAALKAAEAGAMVRTCANCNQPFTAQSPVATYCSGRCRVAAHRRRA
jgi:hypothetical protein